MPDAQPPRNLSRRDTLLEQICRLHAPFFHRQKVAMGSNPLPRRALAALLYRNECHPSVSHDSTLHR
jgi:hypothetical protein